MKNKKLAKLFWAIASVLVLILVFGILAYSFGVRIGFSSNNLDFVKLPKNFKIEVFVDKLGGSFISIPGPNPGPRMLALKDDTVFVSVPSQGKVYTIEDKNKDWKKDNLKVFMSNLNKPHGIAFYNDWVYVAEENRIIRVKDVNNDNIADSETLQIVKDLQEGNGHWTRTIAIINAELYISIGSSCNNCKENNKENAAILRCGVEGINCEVFASGLRNSVGLTYYDNKLFATDNGRDGLGNNLPPDEVNIIKEGKNYGWPLCYGKQVHDPEDELLYPRDPCLNTESSFLDIEAHSAPLGLTFYNGKDFPLEYNNNLFIALHGSWNRNPLTGYKIIRASLDAKGNVVNVEDFATGWLNGNEVLGRPVDVLQVRDSLLVTDDKAGKIYRIYYQK